MRIAATSLFILSVLQTGFAFGQTAQVSNVPQMDDRNPSTEKQGSSTQAKETPCPNSRNQTDEAKYDDYVIRTYRSPEMEGCLRIFKGKKLLYSIEDVDFRISKNLADDVVIPIGTDITGAGKPDAIVSEWSGGAHCCYTFHVFELGEAFKEVARIKADHSDGARFVDLNHDGTYEFEGNDWAFAYWRTSFMSSPAPRIVLKFRTGRFRLAWDLMKKPAPSTENFASLLETIQSDEGWTNASPPGCDMDCGVPVSLWSNMLDLMYTGHAALGWRLLNESWPSDRKDKANFIRDFCKQLRSSRYWSELKSEIGPCPPILPHR